MTEKSSELYRTLFIVVLSQYILRLSYGSFVVVNRCISVIYVLV